MVLFIDVETGELEEVYQANHHTDKLEVAPAAHTRGKPLSIENFTSDTAFATFYATSSPGCRYIHHPTCMYRKVCL